MSKHIHWSLVICFAALVFSPKAYAAAAETENFTHSASALDAKIIAADDIIAKDLDVKSVGQALPAPVVTDLATTSTEQVAEQDGVTRAEPQAEWTIMLYIQGRNNLSSFATKNLQDIANSGVPDGVNFIIQWEQPGGREVTRYKVAGKSIVEIYKNLQQTNTHQPGLRLTEFCNWTVSNYPAKKFALILWNHGLGILDPIWGNPARIISYGGRQAAQKLAVEEITHVSDDIHRGILFDEESRVYLTTQELMAVLQKVKRTIGKKIDVLGFDACFMSMIEVSYLLRDTAQYIVASEDIELAWGWHYSGFLARLKAQKNMTPQQLGEAIVDSYGRYYRPKTHLYTLSLIDLNQIEVLQQNFEQLVSTLDSTRFCADEQLRHIFIRARKAALEFSNPTFIDLGSWYKELAREITQWVSQKRSNGSDRLSNETMSQIVKLEQVKVVLEDGQKIFDSVVLRHTSSAYLGQSRGLSLYFPCWNLDYSYTAGAFAKVAAWPGYLKKNFSIFDGFMG